ncbi:hypothetical protein L1785_03635 [Antribacter sp. KLBMP9083]|uniref:Uncharacterized protein n=1 Tax=Antribacter soli TaxID=2910976 RepID=A0AA41U648_9MICO|nr:hypothetical protein [Antribacter soli]MCF4120061.1 hypothetical protein [Antribacter soli]
MNAFLLLAAADPSPNPTGGTLRPGLTETDVSPGLIGFLVTFAIAAACVLLFVSLTKHLRKARRNAEDLGLPVERRQSIGFRRDDEASAPAEGGNGPRGDAARGGEAPGSEEADGGRGVSGG